MSLNKPERIWMSLNVLKWALMSSITSSIELSNYVKMKCLSPLPFQGKIRLLFAIFGIFLQGNSAWSQVKGGRIKIWKILFHSHDSWSTSYKKILVQMFSSFATIDHKGYFRKILSRILKFGWSSWYHSYIFQNVSSITCCRI